MKTHGFIWAGLHVADLDASIAFYRDTLGLPLRQRGDVWAHFDAGDGAMLELFSGGVAVDMPKGPDRQSAVFALRVDDLNEAISELTSRGVTFHGEIGIFNDECWAFFTDPEGNRVEIKEI